MKEYPLEYEAGRHKYRLLDIYTNFALYTNQYGQKECFTPYDLGMEVNDGSQIRDQEV